VTYLSTTEPGIAAQALADGHVAVIPTETVYGLGAVADDPVAVVRVFAIKGRPVDHPLIAHVASADAARKWATRIPEYAEALMDRFWPGPMTLVFERSARAADYITGGQDTVAVRVPGSPVTRAVLRELASLNGDPAVAIAAPSANRFGRVSPTTAQHAADEIGEFLEDNDVLLDAGPCDVGVESTIVDCTGEAPVILRPGKVTAQEIAEATGLELGERSQVRAPGTLAAHYSPHARVQLMDENELSELTVATGTGVIALAAVSTPAGAVRLCAPHTIEEYAACMYRALREADSLELAQVLAVPPSGEGLAEAIRDRLQRAAAG
jgi:L-threonylcarbamoyladenylate synthase